MSKYTIVANLSESMTFDSQRDAEAEAAVRAANCRGMVFHVVRLIETESRLRSLLAWVRR